MKLSCVKAAPARAREVEERLVRIEGVDEVTANPTTGSVLIYHDPLTVDVDEVIDRLRGWGYLAESDVVSTRRSLLGDGLTGVFLRATTEAALQTLITALI